MTHDITRAAQALLHAMIDATPVASAMGQQMLPPGNDLIMTRLVCNPTKDIGKDCDPRIELHFTQSRRPPASCVIGRHLGSDPSILLRDIVNQGLPAPSNHAALSVYKKGCAIEDAVTAMRAAHGFETFSVTTAMISTGSAVVRNISLCDIPVYAGHRYDNPELQKICDTFGWAAQTLADARGPDFNPDDCAAYYLSRAASRKWHNDDWNMVEKQLAGGITLKARSEVEVRNFLNIGIAAVNRAGTEMPADDASTPYEVTLARPSKHAAPEAA